MKFGYVVRTIDVANESRQGKIIAIRRLAIVGDTGLEEPIRFDVNIFSDTDVRNQTLALRRFEGQDPNRSDSRDGAAGGSLWRLWRSGVLWINRRSVCSCGWGWLRVTASCRTGRWRVQATQIFCRKNSFVLEKQ